MVINQDRSKGEKKLYILFILLYIFAILIENKYNKKTKPFFRTHTRTQIHTHVRAKSVSSLPLKRVYECVHVSQQTK